MRVAVVIPAYNEARNLPGVIATVRREAPGCEVCVGDDGSSDGTAGVAAWGVPLNAPWTLAAAG
jgi:glycosyltransferase involved in cell wall biosynthesis